MRRFAQTGGLVVAVALMAAGSAGGQHATASSKPLPHPSEGRCPTLRMQALDSDAVARAATAALGQAPAVYRGTNLAKMRVTKSVLARSDDQGRGGYPRIKCGRKTQAKTVVVYLEFPAMRPSASLSQGIVLVSKFAGQYRVWAQLH